MPLCKPWCPLVKKELKRIVTEAPWIAKKDLSTDDDPRTIVDEKCLSARAHTKHSEDLRQQSERAKGQDGVPTDFPLSRTVGHQKQLSRIDTATDATKDVSSKSQATELAKMQAETATATATQQDKEQDDKLVETDAVEQTSRPVGEPASMRTWQHDAGEHVAIFADECNPCCPRRISQRYRIWQLEERQRVVDEYLLYKGTGYFEDVCTCSLSCVIHALRNDSFVRSTLLSAALFALGLKLCSELDAWYLPLRVS